MHDHALDGTAAGVARRGGVAALAAALQDSRRDTLATFAAWQRALPSLQVPRAGGLNPPLWELGHVGWFQDYWVARNPQRDAGAAADPDATRPPPRRRDADALYDSGRVAHASRWTLPLPDADATRGDLEEQLAETLGLLHAVSEPDDTRLYAFRLALLHEDMHHEAALYMAAALDIPIDDPRWQPPRLPEPPPAVEQPARTWQLGSPAGGFAFDNELAAHPVALPPTSIDAQVLRWAEFLPFVESGGYDDSRWWSEPGARWLASAEARPLRVLRRAGSGWQRRRHGAWQPLDAAEPACHLSWFEAEAWCRWAGRRLPTEAEWESAAATAGGAFRWGDVWEWTASPFAPYPGFVAHPYRDYSAPWFDGRPVLRGASWMTQPRLHDVRYRNFFVAGRNDVPAGLRSCAP